MDRGGLVGIVRIAGNYYRGWNRKKNYANNIGVVESLLEDGELCGWVSVGVSVALKSFQGATDYASLRSIIDTSRKRGLNEFDSLLGVISGGSVF